MVEVDWIEILQTLVELSRLNLGLFCILPTIVQSAGEDPATFRSWTAGQSHSPYLLRLLIWPLFNSDFSDHDRKSLLREDVASSGDQPWQRFL